MRLLTISAIFLLLAVPAAWGQGNVGTLNGTILDSTGAVIPGATVVSTNNGTGVENSTSSTSAGAYTLPYLAPGTYTLRITAPGFRTANRENVILRVGQTMTVNVAMQLGAVTEEVTVSAAPPLLESGTAEIGRYVSEEEYQNWPIFVEDGQRQIQSFIFRSLPGTTGGEFQGSINGGQQYSHEILIEGIPVGRMDLSGGNNNEMSPSAEAVGEFKLHTGSINAQYNGGHTAVANFNFKSGTNQLHGTVFYYGQNEALSANTYANNSRGITQKSPFRQHNYGYSAGGPIYIPKVYDGRNRSFFFTNFERTTRSNFNISGLTTTLATPDFKSGDFSRLLDSAFTGQANSGTGIANDAGQTSVFGAIYDPLSTASAGGAVTRTPFVNNRIPQNRMSSVYNNINGVGLIDPEQDLMVRNTPTIGTCCPFFSLYTIGIKGDHNISDKHHISGVYNHEYRIRNNNGGPRHLPVPGIPTQTWQNQYTPSRMVRMSINSTLSNTVINRFAAGYNRFRNSNESVFVDEDWASQVGVQGTSPSHFPRMNFRGNEWQGGLTGQIGSSNAGEGFNGSWIFQDDLTIIRGAHTFRVGYEYRRYYLNSRAKNGSGNFNFSPIQTHLPGFANETGHAFASFVLGAVHSAGRGVTTLYSGHRHPSHGMYLMDDWKVTPKLTLNLGVRWEVIEPFFEVTNRMSQVDLDTPNPAAGGLPGAFVWEDRFQETNWAQIGPRFGFAYQVTPKMVVRGGYALTNMPPIRNNWSFNGFTRGFSASIPINAGTSPTGFADDPAHWLDEPYPAFEGTLPDTDPGQGLFTGVETTARDSTRLPYTQNWNLTIQYQLPKEFVLETAYVGNVGRRIRSSYFNTYNAVPTSFLTLGDILHAQVGQYPQYKPYDDFPDNQSVAQALRPFPQYTNVVESYPHNTNSSYHSAQVTMTRRFSGGLGVLGAYTWSKAISQANDTALQIGWSGAVQDHFNRGLERSIATYHVPHVFRLTWLYELPFGKGKRFGSGSTFVDKVLGGWTFSSIHEYRSGNPVSVGQGGIRSPRGFGGFRPDVTGASQTLGGASDSLDFFQGTPYLNPDAFEPLSAENGGKTANNTPLRPGTAPRRLPNVRGPHSSSERMRFVKKFDIYERVEFEFGVAAINPFNRHTRGIITTNLNSADFGKLRINGGGQRVMQVEARLAW